MGHALAAGTMKYLSDVANLYKSRPALYMNSPTKLTEIVTLGKIISCELGCYKLQQEIMSFVKHVNTIALLYKTKQENWPQWVDSKLVELITVGKIVTCELDCYKLQ